MSEHIVFSSKRKRGNPDWGKPSRIPVLMTEFEREVELLGLTRAQYTGSMPLRAWCQRNRNRVYVPEWLLDEWGMTVELIYKEVA